ncbi:MAG TPA: acyltransferase [Vicinamibacterales bacterium]|nr:acyltransferase [Vicinamibacterales bacterium]
MSPDRPRPSTPGGEPPTAAGWQQPPAPRIPALDGVRGVAILLVILFHHTLMRPETTVDRVFVGLARLGWSGVDLFFVLSGFLITGLLLDSKGAPHYYRNFYVRRALRIFPLYYAFLFFTLHISPWLWPDTPLAALARDEMAGRSEAWYWLHLSNVLFAREGTFGHPNLAITWSLAIEEQFYLVWPFVVAALGRRALLWTCIGMMVTALGLRAALLTAGAHWILPYVLPMCRMDALAAGAIVAVAMRGASHAAAVPQGLLRAARVVAPAAAVGVLAIWWVEGPFDGGDWTEPLMQTAGYTTLAVGYAAIVTLAAGGPPASRLNRVLAVAPLRALGRYSYALYLFHLAIRRWIRDDYFPVSAFPTWLGSPLPGQILFYVAATAPALVLAWLSWHLWERRWLELAKYFPYGRRSAD